MMPEAPEHPTICAKCNNVVNRDASWRYWQCATAPRRATFNPVTGQTVADPPYGACRDINIGGNCGAFKQREESEDVTHS
jgi:hypothetical protein